MEELFKRSIMPAKKAYCLMKEGKRAMQKLKKTTAMLMTVLILFGTFAGNASAICYAEDAGVSGTRVVSYDGIKTVSPIAAANKYEAQAVSDKDSATDWTTVSCMPYSLNNNIGFQKVINLLDGDVFEMVNNYTEQQNIEIECSDTNKDNINRLTLDMITGIRITHKKSLFKKLGENLFS